jgi:16S rRNA processing protein RimM
VLLEVGRVARPHGVGGEVVVDLVTDRTERLSPGSELRTDGGTALRVTAARPFGPRWLVTFAGVADRTAAETIAGRTLLAEPVDDPDALWVHDLIGSQVRETSGVARGTVVAVEANPAADLLVLDTGALVPSVFVVSCAGGVTVIDPPAGLFD